MEKNDNLRLPPQSLEAEQALLGAILTNNRAMEKVVEFLKPKHFANPAHGKIFEACQILLERGRLADPITLKDFFAGNGSLDEVGGQDYLFTLANASTTTINAGDYGQQIFDRYMRRQLIAMGTDIVNDAFEVKLDNPSQKQIENAEAALYSLSNEGELEGGPQPILVGLKQTLQNTEKAMKDPASLAGAPTGLLDLDAIIGGLHDSDLIILAGRPGMGKTALATTIAYNVAKHFEAHNKKNPNDKKGVAFFSLEMSADQLAGRILSACTEIEGSVMRTGKLTGEQFDRMAGTLSALNTLPLYVDETPAITVSAIKNRARHLKQDKERGLGLIVIDYLQLITESGRAENRVQALSEMTRTLKIMAKELNVPVLVLSQLSRLVESRENKRPMLSDLRESGSIEQDADIVLFVYREAYYLESEQPVQRPKETMEAFNKRVLEWEQKKIDLKMKGEVIVAKHRHGSDGHAMLFFEGKYTRFGNLEKEDK